MSDTKKVIQCHGVLSTITLLLTFIQHNNLTRHLSPSHLFLIGISCVFVLFCFWFEMQTAINIGDGACTYFNCVTMHAKSNKQQKFIQTSLGFGDNSYYVSGYLEGLIVFIKNRQLFPIIIWFHMLFWFTRAMTQLSLHSKQLGKSLPK